MKKSELRKYIGKRIQFSTYKTRQSIPVFQKRWGDVEEIIRSEVCIEGEWYEYKTLEIHNLVEEPTLSEPEE